MTPSTRRLVAKIGTSSITGADGDIDEPSVARFCAEVAELRGQGHQVVAVTSGAIAAGLPALGLGGRNRPTDAVTLESVRHGYIEGLVFYAVSFGASLLTINPANERGVALFEALVRRTFAAVDDLNAGSLIGLD